MKYKFLLLFLTCSFLSTMVFSQNTCGTFDGYLEEQKQKYPDFYKSLEERNAQLEKEFSAISNNFSSLEMTSTGKKIIPVVVHVIYDNKHGGNLTNEEIQYALDVLNANINGQSVDFESRTPDCFAAVRGNLNVEFRLARKDPNGNPTTGINRVFSSLTASPEPRDAVKALSYWNSYQYFNIWTLKSFAQNTLLGFAQFPWSGSMSTDGVVLLAEQMRNGGTLTHEVGHWLGLRHVWGDADCGDDNVADTPPAETSNFNISLVNFPHNLGFINSSGTLQGGCIVKEENYAGEMFVNYMDYSDDDAQTMFTIGQNEIMRSVLEGDGVDLGFREYMCDPKNLEATGLSLVSTGLSGEPGKIIPPLSCQQKAEFSFFAENFPTQTCLGEQIYLKGNRNQFDDLVYHVWDFGNGVVDSTTGAGQSWIAYEYPQAGVYDVSLRIKYNETNKVKVTDLSVLDMDEVTSIEEVQDSLLVQASTSAELVAMGAVNIIEITLDSLGVYWDMQDSSYFRGYVPQTYYIASYVRECSAASSQIIKKRYVTITDDNDLPIPSSSVFDFEDVNLDTTTHCIDDDWCIIKPKVLESFSTSIDAFPWGFGVSAEETWRLENGVSVDGDGVSLMIPKQSSVGKVIEPDVPIPGYTLNDQETWIRHKLISKSYDLSDFDSPAIKFSWSGAATSASPVNYLTVHYSNECAGGTTSSGWNELATLDVTNKAICLLSNGQSFSLGSNQCINSIDTLIQYGTANAQMHSIDFIPNSEDWVDTVLTKNELNGDNIKFKFEYVSKGAGNNFYLDNILIGEEEDLLLKEDFSMSARVSIFPNPAQENTTFVLEGLSDKDVSINLINVLGQELDELYNGVIAGDYEQINFNLSKLDKGIYFVNIISEGNIVSTSKLILER